MTVHRFFCPGLCVGENSLSTDEARHAGQVLRLRAGAQVELFDGRGCRASGELTRVDRKGADVVVSALEPAAPAPAPAVTILTALPRPQRQPFLFEKCTELAVSRIVPLVCRRSTVRPQASAMGKWERTLVEAAKQCGCLHLPVIENPCTLTESIAVTAGDRLLRLVGSRADTARPLPQVLADAKDASSIAVWIGPEGGLDEDEARTLEESGARAVSLGPQILRIETAVLAVAATVALNR